MSLNGLDDAAVQSAYQSANTEAGGWLLLKYNSRDSVDLLGRGKGGAPDARAAIARYEDASPLYGLIVYRRRKVLIKYVPEGTSRVLLARTAVHWQDILERFAPYETVLEIKTSEGLNDTSLAASFPLHTASPSASSQRLHERLTEISEDAEDSGSTARPSIGSNVSSGSHFSSGRQRAERRDYRSRLTERSPPPAIKVEDVQEPPRSTTTPSTSPPSVISSKKAHISQFLVRDDAGERSITSLSSTSTAPTSQFSSTDTPAKEKGVVTDSSDAPAIHVAQLNKRATSNSVSQSSSAPAVTSRPSERQRPLRGVELLTQNPPPPEPEVSPPSTSSTSSRPLTRQPVSIQTAEETSGSLRFDGDPYDFSRFDPKPKVRLAPRPVAANDRTKRPAMAGVASIPATYRPATAKKQESVRPKSQGPMNLPVFAPSGLPAPPPIPDVPEYKPRPVSRGSIKSLPSHKSTAMTPDKIRLMKAVELRKKQMRKSNPQAESFVPPEDSEVPAVPTLPQRSANREPAPAEPTLQENENVPDNVQEGGKKPIGRPMESVDQSAASSKKADSGISMDYDRAEQDGGGEVQAGPSDERPGAEQFDEDEADTTPVETPKASAIHAASQQVSPMPVDDSPRVSTFDHAAFEENVPQDQPARSPVSPMSNSGFDIMSRSVGDVSILENGLDNGAPVEQDLHPVPTIVMADGSRPLSTTKAKDGGQIHSPGSPDQQDEASDSSDSDLARPEMQRKPTDIAKRRRGFVEPLHIDPDAEYSSDDEFMQELQSATLQEARPVMVTKSPMTGSFPRRPSYNSMVSDMSVKSISINRASTMPTVDFTEMQDRLSPELSNSPYRDSPNMSSASLERMDPLAAMRRNVSSGISRRIQALADNSRDVSPPQRDSSSRSVSPEIVRERQESWRSPPPHHSRASSFRALRGQSSRMSHIASQSSAGGMPQRETNAVWTVQEDAHTGRNSVSVTARIVRPNPIERTESDGSIDTELQQPELSFNQTQGAPPPTSAPRLPALDTDPQSQSSQPEHSFSPTATARSPTEVRTLHSTSRFGRHKPSSSVAGVSAEDFPPPPSHQSATQSPPSTSGDMSSTSRDSTRTSRFFKRMSNIGGSKRKSNVPRSIGSSTSPSSERGSLIGHAGMVPGPDASSAGKERADAPPATIVGDLNIQFPDSLLWKRRLLSLTPTGDLLFSVPHATDSYQSSQQRSAAASAFQKRFPLTDFRCPYVPDLDRQELPHSIVLDFVDGGTSLQVACEDAGAQRRVLGVLKGGWRSWVNPA